MTTVEDFSTLQNTTGRALTLAVCKPYARNKETIELSAEAALKEVSVGTHQDMKIRGGLSAQCPAEESTRTQTSILLSEESFGLVKLCMDQNNKTTLIVEWYQFCPVGTLEQISPDTCK
jgi:aspartate carbamoyltransferase catalytic subunit